jgi:hypothetical protein
MLEKVMARRESDRANKNSGCSWKNEMGGAIKTRRQAT